jgi:RNA polymerase sigma-70 factor (ECF subfamily)
MAEHNSFPTDVELVVGVRMGDPRVFELLFRAYYAELCGFAARLTGSRQTAEDLVHDVFMRVWVTRATWEVHTTIRAYLYAAVRNRARDRAAHDAVEQRWAGAFAAIDDAPGTPSRVTAPDDALLQHEIAADIHEALDTLPPRVRQVAILRWMDGLTRTEIAAVLGVSPKTVDNQMAHALTALRHVLQSRLDPE